MVCSKDKKSPLAPLFQRGGLERLVFPPFLKGRLRRDFFPVLCRPRLIPVLVGFVGALLFAVATSAPAAENDSWFREIANSVGITFQHQDGRSGQSYFIETAASGGGWIDYDRDGDLDLYLINGAATPNSNLNTTPRNRLYQNHNGRFADVTDQAGVGDSGYGMGMCVGDYDADGWLDFVVTNYGPDQLYRNLGNGRFEEVGKPAGVGDERWGASCAFGDLDGDGDLDLYVTHYVNFSFDKNHPRCGDQMSGKRGYCPPEVFDGQTDSLYINQGDGTFLEDGDARGISQARSEKGFGVVLSDVDLDTDLDIYVTNDGTSNRLYLNDDTGVFQDASLLSGAGLNRLGKAEAGMGVDLGDVDGDGLMDLIVTNFSFETNALYKNLGNGYFDDWTHRAGLATPSYRQVGWGVQFVDFDNDGDLDVAIANGHVQDGIEHIEPLLAYKQANQLFENTGGLTFQEVTSQAGSAFAAKKVSRGLAAGDWNNDGRMDLLVTNTNDTIDLLENTRNTDHHWLGLILEGPMTNRFAIGAHVTLQAGERRLVREVRSGGSFLSQPDLRLHFGLGTFAGPVTVTIRWPDGQTQTERIEQLDRYWTIASQVRD